MGVELCPRCGNPVSWYEKRHTKSGTYVYAVHYSNIDGKKRIRKCYLGPIGEYKYVNRLHLREGLRLKGATHRFRVLDYIKELAEYLMVADMPESEIPIVARELEEVAKRLRGRVEH